jgi:hypothetical protein
MFVILSATTGGLARHMDGTRLRHRAGGCTRRHILAPDLAAGLWRGTRMHRKAGKKPAKASPPPILSKQHRALIIRRDPPQKHSEVFIPQQCKVEGRPVLRIPRRAQRAKKPAR